MVVIRILQVEVNKPVILSPLIIFHSFSAVLLVINISIQNNFCEDLSQGQSGASNQRLDKRRGLLGLRLLIQFLC